MLGYCQVPANDIGCRTDDMVMKSNGVASPTGDLAPSQGIEGTPRPLCLGE